MSQIWTHLIEELPPGSYRSYQIILRDIRAVRSRVALDQKKHWSVRFLLLMGPVLLLLVCIENLSWSFVDAMLWANKFLPPRLLDGDSIPNTWGNSAWERDLLYQLYAKSMQPIKQKFLNFAPIAQQAGEKVNTSPTLASTHLLNALGNFFSLETQTIPVWIQMITKTWLLDNLKNNAPVGSTGWGCTSEYCKVMSYPDFVWLSEQRDEGRAQSTLRKSQIVDGSSVCRFLLSPNSGPSSLLEPNHFSKHLSSCLANRT